MAHLVAAALADELDVDDELVRVGGARIHVAKLPSAIDFVHHAELPTGSPGRHRDRDLAHLDQLGLARRVESSHLSLLVGEDDLRRHVRNREALRRLSHLVGQLSHPRGIVDALGPRDDDAFAAGGASAAPVRRVRGGIGNERRVESHLARALRQRGVQHPRARQRRRGLRVKRRGTETKRKKGECGNEGDRSAGNHDWLQQVPYHGIPGACRALRHRFGAGGQRRRLATPLACRRIQSPTDVWRLNCTV